MSTVGKKRTPETLTKQYGLPPVAKGQLINMNSFLEKNNFEGSREGVLERIARMTKRYHLNAAFAMSTLTRAVRDYTERKDVAGAVESLTKLGAREEIFAEKNEGPMTIEGLKTRIGEEFEEEGYVRETQRYRPATVSKF